MRLRSNRATRFRPGVLGQLLVLLALVAQVALGGVVPGDGAAERQVAQLASVGVLCHATAPTHAPTRPARRSTAPPALCPFAVALTAPSPLLFHGAVLQAPPPGVGQPHRELVSARAPPSAISGIGFPRGPPVTA